MTKLILRYMSFERLSKQPSNYMIAKSTKINVLIHQLYKFGLVGILTTIFGIVCYYILLEKLYLPLYPVYTAVYTMGVLISYLFNSRYTFQKKRSWEDGVKYYAMYIIGFLVGLGLLYIFGRLFDYADFILVLLVIPFRILVTFVLIKTIVFSAK